MSDFAAFRREPSEAHRCVHYNAEGRRCGAWALQNEYFCNSHRTKPIPHVIENAPFDIPTLDSRPAIQQALADVAARLAANAIDFKRASLLLYSLQIASTNLVDPQKPTA